MVDEDEAPLIYGVEFQVKNQSSLIEHSFEKIRLFLFLGSSIMCS